MLRSVTIRVTRRDCYEGALDPSGCAMLWQDEHWIPVAVPAGQSRDFVEVDLDARHMRRDRAARCRTRSS